MRNSKQLWAGLGLSAAAALLLAGGAWLAAPLQAKSEGEAPSAAPKRRVVAAGGTVAEIVHALGESGQLVGLDTSSVYPPELFARLPKVGYQRRLSAEGVLSLAPDLLIATEESGPREALAQLEEAGVRVLATPVEHSPEGAVRLIAMVAEALGAQERGAELIASVREEVAQARAEIAALEQGPRVLFIYARGPSMALAGGTGTASSAMIELAGAVNAMDGFSGFKPLSPEALAAAAPDVILVTHDGLAGLGGIEGALRLPGVALTPAGQNGRVAAMDELLLLGFGPRLGQAIRELGRTLREAAPPKG